MEILVVQRRLTHYRLPFFETLRTQCRAAGIRLRLAHGVGTNQELGKADSGDLPWSEKLDTRYFLSGRLCWQPYRHLLRDVDMVVVTHENKLINNLFTQYLNHKVRLGLWGHGANLQGNPNDLRERFKRVAARRADWWFAYTDMSLPLVQSSGFPADRTTVLNNAIDTGELARQFAAVTPEKLAKLKTEIGLRGGQTGLYLGSLYGEKRVDFMLTAAQAIKAKVPGFEFLIVGSGEDRPKVESFCQQHEWAHYLGVKKGQDKADVLALANIIINPGLVGLGILDSFVCGVPMVTTDCRLHSPEIAYLENGINGLMTSDALEPYVDAVSMLLSTPRRLGELRAGCLQSASKYTVDNMARNFVEGVEHCLALPKYRGSR